MESGNKKIIKNTALLYIRMLLSMGIGLYSVRIVLAALGDIDFGIYNVVGGIVTMLAFLNNALSTTTQRFLSYENGKNNESRLNDIFNNSMSLYVLICLLILVLSETVGLWIVHEILVIPENRVVAANIIYQLSILSFIFIILVTPYNAAVIAREKMEVFAYISIAESIIKLGLVYLLLVLHTDKLILYGFMIMVSNLIVLVVYHIYCRKRFPECNYHWKLDKVLAKSIASFAGWSILGAFSNIFSNHGLNILLNRFFGVIVNAARGIAYQVNGALNTCVQNFLIAVRPQIIKSYASGDASRLNELLILSTRVSFYLMYVITIIFTFNVEAILKIWLGSYPEFTAKFVCLVLVSTLLNILAQPLVMLIMATGKIKRYQILSSLNNLLVFIVSFLLLRVFNDPYLPFYVLVGSNVTYYVISMCTCRKLIQLYIKHYRRALTRLILVCGFSFAIIYNIPDFSTGIYNRLIISTGVVIVVCGLLIGLFDTSKLERRHIKNLVINRIKPHQ